MPMRLPDFLIIGAMKAGSTTLWEDLRRHPNVYMPATKEPETLGKPSVLSARGRRRYAALFRGARADQQCGEASTLYSKLPHSRAIAPRAKSLLGADLRLIYIMRDPIERAISHHKHLWRRRQVGPDFDTAVERYPEIVDYGCYARQLEPWLAQFDRGRLLILRFETLIADRQAALAQVAGYLGLPCVDVELNEETAYKSGDVNTALHIPGFDDWFYRLRMTNVYQRLSKLSGVQSLKEPVKTWFQKPLPSPSPNKPSRAMLEQLVALYDDDGLKLEQLKVSTQPRWDLCRHLRAD